MNQLYLSRSGRFAWDRLDGMDGFVFAERFDDLLRRLSEDYLSELWSGLTACLQRHDVDPSRLSWGSGYAGAYTYAAGPVDGGSPLGYFGWIMPLDRRGEGQSLWQMDDPFALTDVGAQIEQDLRRADLPLAIARADLRSYVCRLVVDGVDLASIPPSDVKVGLDLVIDHCTDSSVEWAPNECNPWLTGEDACGRIAQAIVRRDREALFRAFEEASSSYSPSGFRTVVLGFADNLLTWPPDDTLGLDPRAGTPPTVVSIGDHLTLTLMRDGFRRPQWMSALINADGTKGRYHHVHISRLSAFRGRLEAHLTGRATSAALVSLAGALELVVEQSTIRGHFSELQDGATIKFNSPIREVELSALLSALQDYVPDRASDSV